MDDHLINRIREEIKLCFYLIKIDLVNDGNYNYRESMEYQGARSLIKCYNDLIKIYYKKEYHDNLSMKRVDLELKEYLERDY